MAIRTLDERHKRLAEELLRGTPRNQIAEALGVNKATLYNWMKDDLFKAYFAKLAQDLETSRQQRLLPIVFKAAEAVEAAFGNAVEDVQKRDPNAPKLSTLVECMKKVVELERVDRGKPSDIKQTTRADEPKTGLDNPRVRRLVESLDKWTGAEEEADHVGRLASGTESVQ